MMPGRVATADSCFRVCTEGHLRAGGAGPDLPPGLTLAGLLQAGGGSTL